MRLLKLLTTPARRDILRRAIDRDGSRSAAVWKRKVRTYFFPRLLAAYYPKTALFFAAIVLGPFAFSCPAEAQNISASDLDLTCPTGRQVTIIDASSSIDCDNTGGGAISAACMCDSTGTSYLSHEDQLSLAGGTLTGQLFIDGGADEIQLLVQEVAGQTADVFVVEDSAGIDFFHIHPNGEVEIVHTAVSNSEIAFEVTTDAAGFGDVKAIDVLYDTGTLAAAEDEAVVLVSLNETDSTGGDVFLYDALATTLGGATIYGYSAGIGIHPVLQESGLFGNVGFCEETSDDIAFVDCVTAFNSAVTNIQIWDADNDRIYLGESGTFDSIEWDFLSVATSPGIKPDFEYWNGAAWTPFSPIDGTNGARMTGVMAWISSDLTGWATTTVDGDSAFWIRITRTANSITAPTEEIVKTASAVKYLWDKDGDLNIRDIFFEGSVDDAFEMRLTPANPTADRTITMRDETGNMCTDGSLCTGYFGNPSTENLVLDDGVGDSPTVTFIDQTNRVWSLSAVDATGTFLFNSSSGTDTLFNFANAGAGDAGITITGTMTTGDVNADHIDALAEIAAGIKRGPDATDTHLVTTDVAAPGAATCLEMDTDGSLILAAGSCASLGPGGSTAIDDLADAGAGDGLVALAEDVQVWTWNTAATPASFDGLSMVIEHDGSEAGTQRILVVERNATAGTGTVDALVQVNNNDTDGTVTTGIEVTAAAGLIAVGIDLTDPQITQGIIVNQLNTPGTPAVAFGDGNTGFLETSDNTMGVTMGGFQQWSWSNTGLRSVTASGAEIMDAAATSTNPALTFAGDTDTGLGRAAADTGSLVAGAIESFRFNTVASGVNFLETTPAIATADPALTVDGTDTNIDLVITGKGTGIVDLTGGATVPTAAVDTSNTEAASTAFVQQEHDDSAGSCTNQFVSAVNASAAPTCATVTPSDVNVALETRMPSFNVEGAVTGDDGNFQVKVPVASTLVRVSCSTTANAAEIQFYERAENAPNTGTTSMLTSNLTCNSDTTADATTAFADSAVAADSVLALGIKTSTLGSTDILRVYVEYTVD